MMTQEKKEGTVSAIRLRADRWLHEVFRSTSGRYLERKLRSFDNPDLFKNENMAEHFAHTYLDDLGSQNVVQGFIIERIQFIESVLGKDQIKSDTFIDIGDPDGLFIKALNKKGYSANISKAGVRNIYRKGLEVVRCDAEHLPFADKSIDHVLFFQIFEHLPNPIKGLKELSRIAGKSIFISIPYVSKTTIHRFNYCPDGPIFENHIFEFSDEDFKRIISHANFSVGHQMTAEVFIPATIGERIAFLFWDLTRLVKKDPEYQSIRRDLYLGCFKKFSIYHLVRNS